MLTQGVLVAVRWILTLTLVAKGLQSMGELRDGVGLWLSNWRTELQLRECGLRAARRRNLEDSCFFLASLAPEGVSESLRRCETRLAALGEEMDLSESPTTGASASADREGSEAHGIPCETHSARAHVDLHRQRHRGQPPVWPNWIPRWHDEGTELRVEGGGPEALEPEGERRDPHGGASRDHDLGGSCRDGVPAFSCRRDGVAVD